MITLNLLSPTQKEALRARVIFAMTERLMIVLISVMLLGCIFLLLLKIELTKTLAEVQARQVLTSDYARANNDIRSLNRQVVRVEALQKLALSPSSLFRDLAIRTPQGVAITSLDLDMKSGSMRLNGIAARRDGLLAFEAALKQSPYVKSLESPISNLFQKNAINFHFDIILDVAALYAPFEPTL